MRIHEEVSEALATGRPVVALESTIIAHGLPRPRNLDVAREIEAAVRAAGAVPATIAVVAGEVRIGLDDAALEAIASAARRRQVRRARPRAGGRARRPRRDDGRRHLRARRRAPASACSPPAASAACTARRATAGTSRPTSARSRGRPITVVCAGVKSILDVGATLERLETLNVTVLGYGTDAFPGFYLAGLGLPVPWRVDSPEEAAAVVRARGARSRPTRRSWSPTRCPRPSSSTRSCTPACSPRGSRRPRAAGATGKDATPFLLDHFHRETGGREPRGQRADRAAQRRAGGADRRRRGVSRVVVVGDVMVDVVAALPGPLAHGSDTPAPIAHHGGGSGANVAAWLAAAGAEVTLRGRAGAAARRRRGGGARRRGRSRVERDPERATGTCIVLVHPGGERTMIPDAGANDALELAELPAATHLHVTGYALLRDGSRPAALRALARGARARDDGLRRPVVARRRWPARPGSSTGSRAPACCCPTPTRRGC